LLRQTKRKLVPVSHRDLRSPAGAAGNSEQQELPLKEWMSWVRNFYEVPIHRHFASLLFVLSEGINKGR
jgi:hypothetical protein